MGILDDAIREHLDLKRRRGADPAEVERAEREALGPVRRNPDPADAVEADDRPAEGGGLAYDQDDEEDWSSDSPYEHGDEDVGEELAEHDPERAEPRLADDPPASPASREDEHHGDLAPADAGADAPRRLSDMGGSETVEYDVEEALAADGEGDEDVLEETPEFLQDTPDHDRLWFEQRPPRDFDFDG